MVLNKIRLLIIIHYVLAYQYAFVTRRTQYLYSRGFYSLNFGDLKSRIKLTGVVVFCEHISFTRRLSILLFLHITCLCTSPVCLCILVSSISGEARQTGKEFMNYVILNKSLAKFFFHLYFILLLLVWVGEDVAVPNFLLYFHWIKLILSVSCFQQLSHLTSELANYFLKYPVSKWSLSLMY